MSKLAAEINALPRRVRDFIHDLEARADPAGDVRDKANLKDMADGLAARVQELEKALEHEQTVHGLAKTAAANWLNEYQASEKRRIEAEDKIKDLQKSVQGITKIK